MNLLASHRHGLIDQLDVETAALAGRTGDHLQRAMVLHHLYDHSRGSHGWALVEAAEALRIDRGLKRLEAKLGGWTWREGRRAEAKAGLDRLRSTLGEAARARCAAAYRAYRITATPALAGEAAQLVGEPLAGLLGSIHAARRAGESVDAATRRELVVLSEQAEASTVVSEELALAAIAATAIGKAGARLVAPSERLAAFDRAERKGWTRLEAEIVGAAELPVRFRANPAQHFYAMLRDLEERRRKEWREALDMDPRAVELAA
jgi:hypothetical protein